MSQQNINIGASANDGNGDPLRTAFSKTQDNFTELYNRIGGAWTFPASAYPTATAGFQIWVSDGTHDVGGFLISDGALIISKTAGTGAANFWINQ